MAEGNKYVKKKRYTRQQMQYVLTFPLLKVIHGFRKHNASAPRNVKWLFDKKRDGKMGCVGSKILDIWIGILGM